MLEILKEIKITDNEREVYFDSQGDIITGYDVLLWKEIDGRVVITNMAEYDLEKDDFIFADKEDEIEFMNLKCISCPENYYTNQTDMDYCILCNNRTHWAPVNSSTCYRKMVQYLNWNDWFAILLVVLSALGIVLICAIFIIFTRNVDTPVVKASGGLTVCYVILLCHFLAFVSTSLFIGQPKAYKCKLRQALFGISFALCISCILIKSLKILLAFSFDPKLQKWLKGLYRPIPIVSFCTGIQILICSVWITVRSPFVQENFSIRRVIILECNEGSISVNQSSLDSKSGTPPVSSTNACCKVKGEKNWLNGSCHLQGLGPREVRGEVHFKNTAGPTIPRRRLSSI
ncbi:hypothetical protein E2320_019338 [Naja naja]|nr:hypothetical protein E2320_019338 [Naja naja]